MNVMTRKVLIIDGHPVYIHKIESCLKMLTYEDIVLSSTGKEGLQKITSLRPDLVIMSAMLPDTNAYEVCREIKRQCDSSKIIVQVGLFAKTEDIEKFRECGADVVLDRKEKDLNPLQEAIIKLAPLTF